MGRLILRTKPIRVAFNMLCCAVLFCWAGVRPRETISGLFGRKDRETDGRFWVYGAELIDALHPHEPNHCSETSYCEARMREALYK